MENSNSHVSGFLEIVENPERIMFTQREKSNNLRNITRASETQKFLSEMFLKMFYTI